LLLDFLAYLVLLIVLFHNVLLDRLLCVHSLSIELLPVFLLPHFDLVLVRELLVKLLFLFGLHIHDELLLLARIINTLGRSLLVLFELS
jgi:hypothetical protein